jgi:diguanylate cyclase (GGDEF)-like protein
MTRSKQNLWRLFTFIGLIGLVLLIVSSNNLSRAVWEKAEVKMEAYAKIFASASHNIFVSNEALLNIIGATLIDDQTYRDQKATSKLLKTTLANQPYVIAFGLFSPEGFPIAVSSNLENKSLPNLATHPSTAKNFQRTLKSDRMIVGDAYIFHPLQQWVVPIRKAIRNEAGETIAVMTAGLRLDDQALMNQVTDDEGALNSNIVNYHSGKRFMMSGVSLSEGIKYYGHKYLTDQVKASFNQQIKKQYQTSLDKKLMTEEPIVIFGQSERLDQKVIIGARFDRDYDLLYSMYEPTQKYEQEIIFGTMRNAAIYLSIMLVLFLLFRTIAKQETLIREKLTHQALHDSVADMPNRNYVEEVIKPWIESTSKPMSLIYVDLDNFKNINDTFGHDLGDKFLASIGRQLKHCIDHSDVVIRFGGDEFLIFTERDASKALAGRIKQAVSTPIHIDGLIFSTTASLGLAHYPQDATSVQDLIGCADIAMYAAKKNKDAIAYFNQTMHSEVVLNAKIEQQLRMGIQHDEFFMLYQPQYKKDGHIYGFEALARWQNKELGNVRPDVFINTAEEAGYMPTLGNHLLELTLQEIPKIQHHFNHALMFSINLSVKQILSENFIDYLTEKIKTHQLTPSQIMLEVTESVFIEDKEFTLSLLKELKQLGFHLSVDDFGTGYSSLSMLSNYPIDELKIDRAFIKNLIESRDTGLVSSIITIGKHLDMHVISEGVEDITEINILTELGCDCFQGYYFSKPLSLNQILEKPVA